MLLVSGHSLKRLRSNINHILYLQINTEQMKQQLGCLDVNVPPDIDYLQVHHDVDEDDDGGDDGGGGED